MFPKVQGQRGRATNPKATSGQRLLTSWKSQTLLYEEKENFHQMLTRFLVFVCFDMINIHRHITFYCRLKEITYGQEQLEVPTLP